MHNQDRFPSLVCWSEINVYIVGISCSANLSTENIFITLRPDWIHKKKINFISISSICRTRVIVWLNALLSLYIWVLAKQSFFLLSIYGLKWSDKYHKSWDLLSTHTYKPSCVLLQWRCWKLGEMITNDWVSFSLDLRKFLTFLFGFCTPKPYWKGAGSIGKVLRSNYYF